MDGGKPELIEGFSRNTFIAMVRGVGDQAIVHSLIDAKSWDQGIADLEQAAQPSGTFSYTFFRGMARRDD